MHHLSTLVVSVILTTSGCSHFTDDFCLQEAPEGSLHSPTLLGEEKCVLPCYVELNEAQSLSASVPRVSWFFKSNSKAFVPLNNSEFWKKEYNKHYCDKTAYPFPDFRDYSGPSHFDCIRQAGNSYNCSLEHHECFLGTYMCSVSLPTAGGPDRLVDEITTKVIVPPCLIIEPPIPVCFQPSPDNITAKISSNSVSKIELTWTPSVKPTNGSCKLKYCTGSRQYKVKMLVFNSVPLDSTVEPDYETGWLKVRRRRAFYTFRDANISPEKFFMFKVRNRRRHGTVTTPTSPYMNDVTRTKCSRVFYFGNQMKANLTEPPQDTVHHTAPGDSVLIRCSATGHPPPIVTLSHDQDGEIVIVRESISTVQLDLITYKSEIFYCTAKNNFVNEHGMIEQVERSASITVNLVSP